MIVKVKDLIGAALDWAVAKCEGATNVHYDTVACWWFTLQGRDRVLSRGWSQSQNWAPSTDWSHGGPILYEKGIQIRQLLQNDYSLWEYNERNLKRLSDSSFTVVARPLKIGPGRYLKGENKPHSLHGIWLAKREKSTSEMVRWSLSDFPSPDPLVSAMRCYVASEVGEEMDVPDGLIGVGL